MDARPARLSQAWHGPRAFEETKATGAARPLRSRSMQSSTNSLSPIPSICDP